MSNESTTISLPFYKKRWFIWVMLIFIPPIGLILLWTVSNYSTKSKLIISLVFCGLFMYGSQIERSNYKSKGSTNSSSTSSETAGLTMEKYNRIKIDMSYQDVVRILDKQGKETQRTEVDGIKHVVYSWEDNGFSPKAIIVMFENNKVVGKSQLGL